MQAQATSHTLVHALRAHLQASTGQPVDLHETHISWVLLVGDLAYKLKKPVRLPFLDFSTIESRRHFCEEEVRLNRRLAPSLYLDVVPVCGTPEAPRLNGVGPVIDHAVRMRRFAPGALLSELLAAGHLQPHDIDSLALRLADFHRDAPVAPAGGVEPGAQPAFDVLAQLEAGGAQPLVAALRAWVGEQAQGLQAAWLARRRAGAVRECHGDLHLANVVKVGDEVLAFDCIEFDAALRWIDVMSDAAFLSMDLQAHGRRDLAFRFVDVYLQRSGDYAGVQVLRFQEVYRALVRALVGRLRTAAGGPDYLACALRLAQPAGGARLLITHGLSGSGKSSLAGRLLEAAGAIRVRSDVERKRLFGLAALQSSAGRGGDVYSAEATRRTFARLGECAGHALRAGYPVIVDATFLRRADRRTFQALAAELQVPFAILHCQASEAVLRQRVAARGAGGADASEASVEVLVQQLAHREPLQPDELAATMEAATDGPVDVAALWARWRERWA
jgi:uncharacterized protein